MKRKIIDQCLCCLSVGSWRKWWLFKWRDILKRNELLGSYQFGFRKRKSTISELIQLFDTILDAKDKRKEIILVLYDLSAAFDTVCHQTLLSKLKIYGFEERSIKWMDSYLDERTQSVTIKGKSSKF